MKQVRQVSKKTKFFDISQSRVKAVDDAEFIIEHVISTKIVDREGEVLLPEGMVADNFMKNPVVMFVHSYHEPPIGKCLSLKVVGDDVIARTQFAKTSLGKELYYLYKEGFMSGWSAGYLPLEVSGKKIFPNQTGPTITKWELLEYSAAPIPVNPRALTIAKAKGFGAETVLRSLADLLSISGGCVKSEVGVKAVVPYHKFPLAPIDTPWSFTAEDGNKVLGDPPNWERYRSVHCWWDPGNPEVKASYKLPVAKYVGSEIKVVWRGVAAAMAVVLGARGGANIPEADRRGVYNRLAKYYRDFGKEPPEFKEYPSEEAIYKACGISDTEIPLKGKAGRVLSAANAEKIQTAISSLEASIETSQTAVKILSELLSLSEGPNSTLSIESTKAHRHRRGEDKDLDRAKEFLRTLYRSLSSK